MTTRNPTGLLSKDASAPQRGELTWGETLFKLAFGAIQWPWLLRSLYGGKLEEKDRLLDRIGLPRDALPHLGSWKADTYLLHRIVDVIEQTRPAQVVELGSGASSLVMAQALSRNGGGQLISYDQHQPFSEEMGRWLAEHGLSADFRHAPLTRRDPAWPGLWYALDDVPARIDLMVIDGPPWTVHPYVRGTAECLFTRLSPGAVVMLDDAARPGERVVARRWRRNWPDMTFVLETAGSKGLLMGRTPGKDKFV